MASWNTKQQEVLDSINENKNILVSAAAGSGKTAVLVERIIEMVENGLAGIDEILVVTFTTAAAAQMKEKIIKSLEEKSSSDPDGMITGQLLRAEEADIMTIDSFCNKIVRENFSLVGMDPSFEIYDAEEVKLLKEDVLDSILDKYYGEDENIAELSGFLMSRNIEDDNLKSIVLRIVSICESFADPDRWLDRAYEETKTDQMGNYIWLSEYKDYLRNTAEESLDYFRYQYNAFEGVMNPENEKIISSLLTMYEKDMDVLRGIISSTTLLEMKKSLPARWPSFPGKKLRELLDESYVNQLESDLKAIKEVFKVIFTEEDIKDEIEASAGYIRSLISLVRDFRSAMMAEKTKLKRYEFSDVAHAAYKILYDSEKEERTAVGLRTSKQYKYIYIDEYQDSSDLQESILNAVARYDENGYPSNVFMVGDVKQSIYRFRMAKPELFSDKVDHYGQDQQGMLINLNMNYRSREEILSATNFVMRSIMKRTFGGIEYSDDVALNTPDADVYSDNYPECPDDINAGGKPEIYMINNDSKSEDGPIELKPEEKSKYDEGDRDYTKLPEDEKKKIDIHKYTVDEIEAIKIGEIIREIIDGDPENDKKPLYVRNEDYDPKKPESEKNSRYRRARYGDIVILQRAVKGSTPMVRIYEQMGIPVIVDDPSGYFEAIEIMTMMSVLRIIDNIEQDIPLASVLLSRIGGLTDSELATVVSLSVDENKGLAEKCKLFIEGYDNENSDEETRLIAGKLKTVFGLIDKWTVLRPYISIAALIDRIIDDTQYDCFAAAMPEGKRRMMNLKLLRYRALSFENGRNVGLFDFIRYIDKCAKKEMEFSEAQIMDDVENMVHITSVHKSKGLEYPIVIVARMGKRFRLSDMSATVISDSDYYIAMDRLRVVNDSMMVRQQSVKKSVIKILSDKASMAEEARLLYVAMTRAKEKLYLTGTYKNDEAPLMIQNKSLMAFLRLSLRKDGVEDHFTVNDTDNVILADRFVKRYSKKSVDYLGNILKLREDIKHERAALEESETEINPYEYKYPYERATTEKSKRSVSEIKHMEMKSHMEISDDSDVIITNEENSDNQGAKRGTITHELFERLDYGRVASKDELIDEFARILSDERYTDEDRELINKAFLSSFYSEDESSLFSRMRRAFLAGKLFRERQFITGISGNDLPSTAGFEETKDSDDFVIVQGIIDAFFYEDDEIVLVDYKTDRVKEKQELIDRYGSQMYIYAMTLEKLTGHRVKDVILYSTRLGEVSYPDWRDYHRVL